MLPIKHSKEPLGKGLEAHPTAFSMQHLANINVISIIDQAKDNTYSRLGGLYESAQEWNLWLPV